MPALEALNDNSFQLTNTAVGILRSLVTESHREAGLIAEMRENWSIVLSGLSEQVAATETMWELLRETWSGGETIVSPDHLTHVFDLMNSLMSNSEVVFVSVVKMLEHSKKMSVNDSVELREFCEGVLSGSAEVDLLAARIAAVRAEFVCVMKSIRQEVNERGITERELFQEEMDAREKLSGVNPVAEAWRESAQRSGAPEYMRGERGGSNPF